MAEVTLSPGTMADDATVGTVSWSNPDNAKVSDDVYARSRSNNGYSHYLKATNFGFSIPSGATINGILVEVERYGNQNSALQYAIDTNVRIIKSDGSIGTTNKADTVTKWSKTQAYYSYGSSSDLWDETWDDTKINDVDFGVAISVYTYDDIVSSASAYIDHIRISIFFTDNSIVSPFPSFQQITI